MANAGIMDATSHTLSAAGAYTLTKFKREVDNLGKEYNSKRDALTSEVGIKDGEAFDKRRDELTNKKKKTPQETKELEQMDKTINRLVDLRNQLDNDEVTLDLKPMSYEDWHALKQENKELKLIYRNQKGEIIAVKELFEVYELAFENILWIAPQD